MLDNGLKQLAASEDQSILERKRILIAEDDTQIRNIIGSILKKLRVEVHAAVDGVDAIEIMQNQQRKKEPFDLALIDLMMPRMNGLGLLRFIRDNIHFSDLPVIIFSGVDEERELHECRCLGIDDFIPKPLTIQNMISILSRSLIARKNKDSAEQVLEQDHTSILSSHGFPLEFGGFPMPKSYALRPSYYRCPFCETTFTAPRLTNRALKPDYNDRLAIGLYREGLEKNFMEYPLTEMIVCPECFYTSDRIGFLRIWTKRPSSIAEVSQIPSREWEKLFFPINSKAKKQMQELTDKRLDIVSSASGNGMGLFRLSTDSEAIPRSPEDALITYDLAVQCARFIQKFYRGEPTARLLHKSAGYLLKRFYIYGIVSKSQKTREQVKIIKQQRVKTMFEAMQALMMVNDIDFNVLEERLYCITRRFFLSDMLLPFVTKRADIENMNKLRKQCVADMKISLIRARQAKSPEVKTIERFLLPLENRYYDIVKEEKMAGKTATAQQQKK